MDILKALRSKRSELQQELDTVDAAINILGGTGTGNPKKRTVSAAAKRKMSLAAKKRWAARKAKQK